MSIEVGPIIKFENLENLYLELVPNNVDLRKKRPSYLSKENKKTSKLLCFDAVKAALLDVDKTKLKKIYLIGSEPLFNPDFNKIIRYCLKFTPVVVVTGAQSINEKKARFLYKLQNENENNNKIEFEINLYHFDERENDSYCQRGDFRKVMHGIESLQKYDFYPKISVKNVLNIPKNDLIDGFNKVFSFYKLNILPEIKIINLPDKDVVPEKHKLLYKSSDFKCSKSRVFTYNGVFACPILSGDNRGCVGYNLKNFSKKNYLETNNCVYCLKENTLKKS